jgi:hypothetical protein
MTQAADNVSSTSGQFAVDAHPDDHATEITATGPDRGTALAAIFTGVATAMLRKALPEPAMAAVAVPIRADGPDFPSLIPALAGSLFDGLEENPGVIGPVRIDGILRTDEGLTAWGYILASSTPAPPFGLFRVDDVHVQERDRSVTIRLRLTREAPPA